jgi:hypothetical protein
MLTGMVQVVGSVIAAAQLVLLGTPVPWAIATIPNAFPGQALVQVQVQDLRLPQRLPPLELLLLQEILSRVSPSMPIHSKDNFAHKLFFKFAMTLGTSISSKHVLLKQSTTVWFFLGKEADFYII